MKKQIINNIIECIGQTPLIRINKLTDKNTDAEVLAKLEFFNPGGSVKDRPCLQMIEDAEQKNLISEGATIIEPTTGNTGIGLAMICAVKGYKCILTMPEDLSLERIYLLKLYGAKVVLTPARKGVEGSITKAKELQQKTPNSFMPLQFESQSNPQSHRVTTAAEILEVVDEKIDVFVAGIGTGGTVTGVGEVLKKKYSDIKIVAVEPENCSVLSGKKLGKHRIQGLGAGFVPPILNRKIIDDVMVIRDQEAYDMSRLLGEKEGLCVGISSGAAMVAAKILAKKEGVGKRIVTLFPDTGERYFSMEQYFQA